MKTTLIAAVEKYREQILAAERYIWNHPETGFRETKTSEYLEREYEALGYKLVKAGDIPGFYTCVDTGKPGPEILVLGEMDALPCPGHPQSDPKTGAVHCCGHHAQSAALLGVAAALTEPEVLKMLCGRIRLCAVPAEELIELDYRTTLKWEGRIKYFGGKSEFLRRGYFDGVDMAFMVHTSSAEEFSINLGGVGCLAKRIDYRGVAAHAGSRPWEGKNALYAAHVGLAGINALRETFQENDIIRVHPIMTYGGESVNAIPDQVHMESYVRGKTFEAIRSANDKVNRALSAGALAMGANVEIQDIPGYAPIVNDLLLTEVAREAHSSLDIERPFVKHEIISSSSTDMGDLSCIMPVIHPQVPGATGSSHGDNFYIRDPELACVTSAKWQVIMLYLLLKDNAVRAREIIDRSVPRYASKEDYFAYVDQFYCEGKRIAYEDNGFATVKL